MVERKRTFLSADERVARLQAMRESLAKAAVNDGDVTPEVRADVDRSVDEEIAWLRRGGADIPPPSISDADRTELMGREGEAAVKVCGPKLAPKHIPREMLKLELLDRKEEQAAKKSELIGERAREAAAANRLLAHLIEEVGGRVHTTSEVEACVIATMPAVAALSLVGEPSVRKIQIEDRPRSAYAEASYQGDEIRMAIQAQQFWDAGIVGDVASSRTGGFSELTAGIVDEGFQDQHVAFLNSASSTSTSRINGRWNCAGNWVGCGGNTCTQYATNLPWRDGFETGDNVDHGTSVASILVGDFLDGQHPNSAVVPVAERSDYSGYAREAGVAFLQSDDHACGNRAAAINRGLSIDVDVLSMSVCEGQTKTCPDDAFPCSHDCRCEDDGSDLNDEVNAAFADGILTVKAAGNEGPPDDLAGCCLCTVTSPGDAEGAIAVGGHGVTGPNNTGVNLRNHVLTGSSSFGRRELRKNGSGREGKVVGISAPRVRRRTASCPGGNTPCATADIDAIDTEPIQGTSFAAPTVAATALLLKQNTIENGSPSTWLDQAEIMKLYLFAQGDRLSDEATTSNPSLKLGRFFSDKYGAGRLRTRMYNADGMDSPYAVRSGWTTLEDGEVFVRILSSDGSAAAIPAGADSLKVLAWWEEPRTAAADSTPAAHISLELLRYDATCNTLLQTLDPDDSFDTRKMKFHHSNVAGSCYRMRLVGNAITEVAAFGPKSRRVNWMFIWEDDHGDSASGPIRCTSVGVPADCVEPL